MYMVLVQQLVVLVQQLVVLVQQLVVLVGAPLHAPVVLVPWKEVLLLV
jgi:hypothetical protein